MEFKTFETKKEAEDYILNNKLELPRFHSHPVAKKVFNVYRIYSVYEHDHYAFKHNCYLCTDGKFRATWELT